MNASVKTLEDPLNLTYCDTQQWEFIGSIQGGDAGAVLVVDMSKTPATIVAYSENAPQQAWCKTYRIRIGQPLEEIIWDENFSQTVLHKLVQEMHEGRYLRTFSSIKVPHPDSWADTDSLASMSDHNEQENQFLNFVVSASHCGNGAAADGASIPGTGLILLEFERDEEVDTRRDELATQLTEIGRMLEDNLQVNAASLMIPTKVDPVGGEPKPKTPALSASASHRKNEECNFTVTPHASTPSTDAETETVRLASITAQRACDAVMRMAPEFDRGMVYRFADDMSGDVIHEIKKDFIASSYMGMRFPAGDVPLSSRRLYIINGLRYIQNADDQDVSIVSTQGLQVDLSHCRMRACAAPHIAYLRNMGVKASMSVALVVGGELWGLLAFHGYTRPFKPSLHQRIAFETVSRMVSIRIESLLKAEKSSRLIDLSQLLVSLKPQHPVEFLCRSESDIRKILRADAIAFKSGSHIHFFSEPSNQVLKPDDDFWRIMEKHPYEADMLVASTRLQMEQVGAQGHTEASGMIYFQYGTDSTLQFAALRAVRTKDVNWAGSPDEAKLQIGNILNPRKSFESYMEKARKESKKWSEQDVEIANSFKDVLLEKMRAETLSLLNLSLEASHERNYSFFAQMSHELRTPIQAIMDILQKSGEDPAAREEAISTAMRSGSAMMNILNDILTMTTIKPGQELQTVEFKPAESIGRTAEVMKAMVESKKIVLAIDMTSQMGNLWCTADKTKFDQITTNVINNAIHFTPAGGKVTASLQIFSTFQEADGWWKTKKTRYLAERQVVNSYDPSNKAKLEWLCCAIEDTGCGIAERNMDTVFRPYVQAASGVPQSKQGTGMGLHICTEHVRNMTGVFRCASTENQGTMFYFAIPVQDVKYIEAEKVKKATKPVSSEKAKKVKGAK